MAYVISNRAPDGMRTEELLQELDSFTRLAIEVVERYAVILAELRKRRQPHPFFRHPVLHFFQSIVDKQLSPEAAIALGNQKLIKALLPLSLSEQTEIAHGKPVPVATVNEAGEVVSDDLSILRMDPDTLSRAFGPDGIRTVAEQAEIIRAAGRVVRHGMITVLRDETMIKVGNQKIKPEELEAPLLALGYRLTTVRETGTLVRKAS